MALRLSRQRAEPPADVEHYHVWYDTGGLALLCEAPRFRTRQAARNAAVRHGLTRFMVMKCSPPCRVEVAKARKRKRKRKRRKRSDP